MGGRFTDEHLDDGDDPGKAAVDEGVLVVHVVANAQAPPDGDQEPDVNRLSGLALEAEEGLLVLVRVAGLDVREQGCLLVVLNGHVCFFLVPLEQKKRMLFSRKYKRHAPYEPWEGAEIMCRMLPSNHSK